jgi:hypothetical protein
MKLRIQDNSFRFRITLKELEELQFERSLVRESRFQPDPLSTLRYEVIAITKGPSTLHTQPGTIQLQLSPEDLRRLSSPEEEGVYLRREWTDSSGKAHRSMAFIEKDRPATACSKPDEWIYDYAGRDGWAKGEAK